MMKSISLPGESKGIFKMKMSVATAEEEW